MGPKFRASEIRNSTKLISPISILSCVSISVFADHDHQEQQIIRIKSGKSFDVNDEYLCTLRTKSNVEFLTNARLVVHESPPSTSSSIDRRSKFSEAILLESPFLLMLPELKGLLIDYLNVSAKASNLCTRLLANVELTRSNTEKRSSPESIESIASDLLALRSPFSDLDKRDFALIHDEYAAVSYRLNCTRKKVARKIRSMRIIDRLTCGLTAITARTLAALDLDPDPAVFRCFRLRHQIVRNGGLEKVGEQLEAAAKGSYILNREMETTSRLVVRLGDAVEHGKAMMRLLVERKEEKFAVAVAMDEVKKNNRSIRKQVEDVEEHLYLCIVTINRTRASVIDQM